VTASNEDLGDLVEDFFESTLAALQGFEVRASQRAMAMAVAGVLTEGGRLAVEAETGTGKSLAYLVPLLLHESCGGASVVATKTLQLQEQLMRKELPFLLEQLRSPRKVVQARGWSNYLCLRKVESPDEETVRLLGPDLPRLRGLADRAGGRLTRQDATVPNTSWQRVQADPLDCQKQHCSHFSKCGLFAERRELEDADLILTNHAFLLADLKVRRDGGGLLPACSALVLDEAHRLDDVATDHLTVRFDAERLASGLALPLNGWLEAARFAMMARLPESDLLEWSSDYDLRVVLALKDACELGEALLAEIAALRSRFPGSTVASRSLLRSADGETVANLASELALGLESLVMNLEALSSDYTLKANAEAPPELARLARTLSSLVRDLDFLLAGDDDGWVFLCDLQPPALLARPVNNSETLDRELFAEFRTVIVTSATLKVNDSFAFFFQRSGFGLEPARQLSLASPFDASLATFVGIADQGPDPAGREYFERLIPSLARLAVGLEGRTFLLATSHRSMLELARGLGPWLQEEGVGLLVQGQAAPGQLLKRFCSPGAHVLLGVDTFWEGVDIPGERLSCVVLTKLPFPVPSDPLFMARCHQIDRLGGRSFDELSVPLTALKVKQGFGRLLRSSRDRGIFLLLDPRMGRKAYGRTLAGHLPGHAIYGAPESLVDRALAWAEENLD
jgi:ATP-dependent DNA helicase DinG